MPLSIGGLASAQTMTGELGAHDPSTLQYDGSRYYYFATGQGIAVRSSNNRQAWSAGPSVFNSPPAWTTQAVPGFTGHFWAPDIAYFNGQYHLYYSVSTWGSIDSAIGLATSPTLTNAVWTDRGKVVQSDAAWEAGPDTDTTAFNAIDPSILVDDDGKVWMAFGSYSSGIVVTEINPQTGKRMNTGALQATVVANNAPGGGWGSSIEGAALIKKGNYYYLFVNYGTCCSGVDSTYEIRVGRSTSPTGPFTDRNGVDLRNGGGTLFADDDANRIGPGHFSTFSDAGQDYFSYHFYNGDAAGSPTYGLEKLYWTADAWPSRDAINPDFIGSATSAWGNALSWSSGAAPDGVGHVANFSAAATSQYTIGLDGGGRTVGTINFRGNANYRILSVGGATLTLDADAGKSYTAINVARGNHSIHAAITAVDPLAVNVTPADAALTFSNSLTGVSLTKYGYGTLALSGQTTIAGTVFVRYGTLDVSGSMTANGFTSVGLGRGESATMRLRGAGSFIANADFNVGDTGDNNTAATGTLELRDNASLTVNVGGFFVGSGFFANTRANGVVNQFGGTLTVNATFDGAFIVGGRNSSAATGEFNLIGGVVDANTNVRIGGRGTGTVNQSGGVFDAASYVSIGRYAGSTGTWNIDGGELRVDSPGRLLIVGEAGGGTLNVDGGLVSATGVRLGHAGGSGVIHLDGGVMATAFVSRGSGSGTVFFDGGTLRANADSSTFMQGLTAARIGAGGAILDASNFSITIAQPLLHDATLGTTPDGGLAKLGSGTLRLTGANSYTGTTAIEAGTLVLAGAASSTVFAGAGADLRGGVLVFDYSGATSPADSVRAILAAGFAMPTPFADGAIRATTLPDGLTIGWTDDGVNLVTIMATLPGDSNLDSAIDFTDLLKLARHFGDASADWDEGDSNYDGVVDFLDLLSFARHDGQASLDGFAGEWALARSLVPEPAGLMLAAMGVAVFGRRRSFVV